MRSGQRLLSLGVFLLGARLALGQVEPTSHFANLDGVRVHYTNCGTGEHGLPALALIGVRPLWQVISDVSNALGHSEGVFVTGAQVSDALFAAVPFYAGLTEPELARLASPIGLDLGARTPEETAVSIAAEIVARQWGGSGERLASTEGRIHHDD